MKKPKQKHLKEQKPLKKPTNSSALTILLVLLLSFAAIATGIALPGLSAGLQSRKYDKIHKTQELDPGMLCLTGDDRKLEKLRSVNLLDVTGFVELEGGSFSTQEEAKAVINDVLGLVEEGGIPIAENRHWEIQTAKAFLILPDTENPEGRGTNIIWAVEARDGKNNLLRYYMDDSTGLIVSIYAEGMRYKHDSIEAMREGLLEALSKYYSFTDTELRIDKEAEQNLSLFYISFIREGEKLYSIPIEVGEYLRIN